MKTIIFKYPSIDSISIANQLYDDKLEELLEDGVPNAELVLKLSNDYGVFPDSERNELEDLSGHPMFKYPSIGSFKNDVLLYKFLEKCLIEIMTGTRRLKLEQLYTSMDIPPTEIEYQRYIELNHKKGATLKISAENFAEQEKADYLTYACCINGDNKKPVWSSYERFKKEKNVLLTKLIQLRCMEFLGGFNQTILRRIARHSMWRSKWISATKTGAPIFEGAITNWNINQTLLSYWSNFYDSIYASYEPPENFIVERDDFLDSWLESKSTESKNRATSESDEGFRATFTKHKVLPAKKR